MPVRRVLRRIGNFFSLSDNDVPQEVITTPVQSTFEIGPHNHIDWIRYNAAQALTPNGAHVLVDANLDDTEQYCWQILSFSFIINVAPTQTNYRLSLWDTVTGLEYMQSVHMGITVGNWVATRQGQSDSGASLLGKSTLASGIIVPPGFDLRWTWGNAGASATGNIQYILLKYPWGSRPLVLPGG